MPAKVAVSKSTAPIVKQTRHAGTTVLARGAGSHARKAPANHPDRI
jgi:hypothetical protein